MLLDHVAILEPIEPEELDMLQRVFDNICEMRHFRKKTDEAVELAAMVMNLYQHGIRDEQQLLAMIG